MELTENIPRTKIHDKLTGRDFYIYETLPSWCVRHSYNYNNVRNGSHERFVVAKEK